MRRQQQLKEATVTARLDRRTRRLIEVAAADRGVTVSRFVAGAAENEARRAIAETSEPAEA